jgi:hypothetical protein
MLAEIWHTDRSPFYLARLPGAVFDPPDHPTDPFAPPTAVLPKGELAARRALSGRSVVSTRWEPVPVTIVRLFLEERTTEEVALWVKCADHGAAKVDRFKLCKAYREDAQQRTSERRDTPNNVTVIGLHDVAALSST